MGARVGFVGAGWVSAVHIEAVKDLRGVEAIGVVDLDRRRAEAVAEAAGLTAFVSLESMVRHGGVNAVHVLTPPHAQLAVAESALRLGCDVLVEKPFGVEEADGLALAALAEELNRTLCVDHSLVFDPQIRRVCRLVERGEIGDVLGVDVSFLESDVLVPGAFSPHLADGGQPLRDLGVHALSLIEQFMGRIRSVEIDFDDRGRESAYMFDEWAGEARCDRGVGQFRLSWNVEPRARHVVVYGTESTVSIELLSQVLVRRRTPQSLPAPVQRAVGGMSEAASIASGTLRSVSDVARGRLKRMQGIRDLIAAFYESVSVGAAPPVDPRDAARLVGLVEVPARRADAERRTALAAFNDLSPADVLVTGAGGRLGRIIVEHLVREGYVVRALHRSIPESREPHVQYVIGDLADPEAVHRAVAGVEFVVHAGAAMSGSSEEFDLSTDRGDAQRGGELSLLQDFEIDPHLVALRARPWRV